MTSLTVTDNQVFVFYSRTVIEKVHYGGGRVVHPRASEREAGGAGMVSFALSARPQYVVAHVTKETLSREREGRRAKWV